VDICLVQVCELATYVQNVYHLHYRDCASSRSSGQYVWDWYSCFSLPSYCSNTGASLIPCPFLFLLPFHTSSAHKSQIIQKQAVGAITSIPSTSHHVNHSSLECIRLLMYISSLMYRFQSYFLCPEYHILVKQIYKPPVQLQYSLLVNMLNLCGD